MLLQVSREAEMSDALLWNEIGNIYLKIGSLDEAIAAYLKAIELNPDYGWSYSNLGRAYFLTGEFGHALFQFRKCIQFMDTPENQALVWNKIGDAYRALKDIENAIQAYKKADDLEMGVSSSEQNAAGQPSNLANLREMIKMDKTIPDIKRLLSEHPKMATQSEPSLEIQALADGFQSINLGHSSAEKYPPPDEMETKASISSEPNRITVQDTTISAIGNHQNTSCLVKDVEKSPLPKEKPLFIIPDTSKMVENLPNEGKSQDEPEQISNSLTDKRQEKVQDGKSEGHASGCTDNNDLEEILAKVNIYENITRVNPTNDRAWDTLGKLYKSLGRYKDAICAYQKAIEMAPDREVYYYYLGLLYSVEQQNDDAVLAFQLVLRKNPDYVLAHSALAGVYHRMGLENKANHHIATALPKMSNESAYNRACFYAICGDLELAFELLRLALKNKDTTIEWIKSDPDLDPIRTDQRYQELISEKDQPAPEHTNGNFFSSELENMHNRLLPILNRSLAR
jgi:tetratricopeptide (TPR) repeat protein